jgi:hypothetical protein
MQPSSEPTQTIKYWQAIFGMKFANHLKKSTVKLISSAERERERERERGTYHPSRKPCSCLGGCWL